MACSNYRIVQLTNTAIGAVAVNSLIPLGNVTRRISSSYNAPAPFDITTSGADTVVITQKGYYKIFYNCSLVAAAAGVVTLNLLVGGASVYSVSQQAASGDTVNLTLAYDTRVFANCASLPTNCPQNIQIQLATTAITGGTGNLIVDSCVNG